MSSYLFELPTTGAISFSDFCYDQSASYISETADTTEARANLRAALKEYKRSDDDEKDYLKLVKILDDYIPKLCGIIACVDNGELVLRTEPIFSWRTTLSSTLFNTSPRVSLPSLSTELAFTLLTYGFALANLARAVVISLGSYETERAISDTDRKAKDDRLGFAVTLLCKAAGIFEYIAKEVLASWDTARELAIVAGTPCPRPPDLTREILIGLSKMTLADAQTLAVRKLLSRAAYDSTLNPGPPLPKSHPSPALAAKLHLECGSLYSSARALAKTPGASRPIHSSQPSKSKTMFKLGSKDKETKDDSNGSSGEEVSPELRRYLADEVALHNALAHKWLGVDVGENGEANKEGIAVGFLAWAKKELEELKSGGLGHGGFLPIDREKEMRECRKARVQAELFSVSEFLKGYKRMNDSYAFQAVPPQSDLQASIPAGRAAVAIKPYTRPQPAFGPGSIEYIRRQTEELDLLNAQDDGDSTFKSKDRTTYAGAGSYF
ncbi:pH-response regulator protein palC [Abortiporus biennis]